MAERKQFLLRIDPGLWADLEAWAADDLRSVNGQIEFLLREQVRRRRQGGVPAEKKGNEDERPASGDSGS